MNIRKYSPLALVTIIFGCTIPSISACRFDAPITNVSFVGLFSDFKLKYSNNDFYNTSVTHLEKDYREYSSDDKWMLYDLTRYTTINSWFYMVGDKIIYLLDNQSYISPIVPNAVLNLKVFLTNQHLVNFTCELINGNLSSADVLVIKTTTNVRLSNADYSIRTSDYINNFTLSNDTNSSCIDWYKNDTALKSEKVFVAVDKYQSQPTDDYQKSIFPDTQLVFNFPPS